MEDSRFLSLGQWYRHFESVDFGPTSLTNQRSTQPLRELQLSSSAGPSHPFVDDDGSGVVRRYSIQSGVRVFADQTAGTIDYTNGKISIDAIKFTSTVNNDTSIDFTKSDRRLR